MSRPAWMDDGPSHDDAQDDDEDLRSDPVALVDLGASLPTSHRRPFSLEKAVADRLIRADAPQQHISKTLRRCYTSNVNGMHEMIGGLTDGEKGILRGVLTF